MWLRVKGDEVKRLLTALVALSVMGCSSTVVVKKDPGKKDQWVNITNANNKVVASFNQADGEIVYSAKPEEAFETLLAIFGKYQQSCKPVEEKKPEAKPEPKKEKKK